MRIRVTHSIGDWIVLCFAAVGRDWREHVDVRTGFVPEYRRLVSDPNTIRLLGWAPTVTPRGARADDGTRGRDSDVQAVDGEVPLGDVRPGRDGGEGREQALLRPRCRRSASIRSFASLGRA